MALYLISYDLHKVRNYDKLIAALEQSGATKALLSVWFADLAGPATGIRDALRQHIDSDDSLVVVELKPGSQWATVKAPAAAKWLKENIKP